MPGQTRQDKTECNVFLLLFPPVYPDILFLFLFPVTRGCDKKSRGWSISMFTGNMWQDLLGCDFVLDLIGEMEDVSNPSSTSQSSGGYPITPERDRNFFLNSAMDSWVTLSSCPKASGPIIQWPISVSSCCAFFILFFPFNRIPPAPGIQAPTFPPPSLPPEFSNAHRGELLLGTVNSTDKICPSQEIRAEGRLVLM